MSNFQPLEVVDAGSETQPQVVEKLNKYRGNRIIKFWSFGNSGMNK